jgi:hypothetical protein
VCAAIVYDTIKHGIWQMESIFNDQTRSVDAK